ncbi:hypothetical protein ACRRTK_002554 [Alexandromys fortis]
MFSNHYRCWLNSQFFLERKKNVHGFILNFGDISQRERETEIIVYNKEIIDH